MMMSAPRRNPSTIPRAPRYACAETMGTGASLGVLRNAKDSSGGVMEGLPESRCWSSSLVVGMLGPRVGYKSSPER